MQFLPTVISSGVSALGGVMAPVSAAASAVAGETNAFLNSLNEELAAAGVKPVVDVTRENPLPQGFRTVARDVSAKIDGEDVNTILASLRKKGVKDSALEGVENLLASGQTPTLGSVVNALVGQGRKSAELTDEEMQQIGGFLQKLGFNQDEMDELTGMMQNGHGLAALRAINQRITELGDAASINASELRALARGLDISEDAMRKIAALMGDTESGEISGKDLESLLAPAVEELAAERAEKEKLARELKDSIDTALRDRKIRETTEPVADTRGSKGTERAETRMRDDLTEKGNKFFAPGEDERAETMRDEENAFADQQDTRERNAREHAAANTEQRTVSAKVTAKAADDAATASRASSQRGEGFSTLVSRLDAAPGMTAPAQTSSAAPQPNASAAYSRQDVFSQVEQGMLRQLADGSRQMTLRLDPAELGQLTLLLTVKGGEVRAVIRAESAETTALLSEQMSQLRATLEEQGLKVAQLDVETQLPNDTTRDNFSGMDMFNQEQEMREQARFLRLAKLRRESGEALAQDVQSMKAEEEISPSGLHIIA